jgi:hypothetical protein
VEDATEVGEIRACPEAQAAPVIVGAFFVDENT